MSCGTTARMQHPNEQVSQLTRVVTVQQWKCDICRIRVFDSYDEACRHEEQCKLEQDQKRLQPQQMQDQNTQQPMTPQPQTAQRMGAPQPPATEESNTRKKKVTSTNTSKAPSKATEKQHSFFAPRAKKSRPQNSCEAKPSVPTGKPHAFFAPRTKTNVDEETTAKVEGFKANKSRRSQQKKQIKGTYDEVKVVKPTKSKRSRQTEKEVKMNEVAATANALAEMIKKDVNAAPKLAGIFCKTTKEIIGQQRQAEFQAKRRMERQREQERQQKRAKAAPVSNPPPSPSRRYQRSKPRLPLAPKFPTPSHVLPEEKPITLSENSLHWVDIQTKRSISTSSEEVGTPNKLISSAAALDSMEETRDLISEAFANILIPPQGRKSPDGCLWVDKYGMEQSGLIGEATRKASESLTSWIDKWREARQGALDRMAERQRKLAKGKKKKIRKAIYKNDDFLDDEDKLCNLCLITGPPASGKTSLVHHAARQRDCKVLEINTAECRGGSSLKHAIQEATQSCSSLDLLKKKRTFLQPQSSAWNDSDGEDEPEPERSSLTVILIDEVDITYEAAGDDSGFWTALSHVARTAKCPIILTANTVPPQLGSFDYQHTVTQRPTPMECADKVLQICRHEQIQIQPGLEPEKIHSQLSWISRVCDCDLRRMMNELQLFAFHSQGLILNSPKSVSEKESVILSASLGSCDNEKPTLLSLKPSKVPADEYSIVTLEGINLGGLIPSFKSSYRDPGGDVLKVSIGRQKCRAHIVNKHTMLVLCPPCPKQYPSREEQIASISIQAKASQFGFLELDSRNPRNIEMPGGKNFPCTQRLHIEYVFPEDEETKVAGEEYEFDNESDSRAKPIQSRTTESTTQTLGKHGMTLWNEALSKLGSAEYRSPEPRRTTEEDIQIEKTLERLSSDALVASDAAVLEGMQTGVPFLSGACQGFAFDFTEVNDNVQEGKLRKTENMKPPPEERLFSLGWKDNCYFYGDSETYMTFPHSALERRQLCAASELSRGKTFIGLDCASNGCEKVEADDFDVQRECTRLDEDMFLPRPLPPLIKSLPSLLRKCSNEERHQKHWTSNQILQRKQKVNYEQSQRWACQILPPTSRAKAFYRGFGPEKTLLLEGSMDSELVSEYIPMLRRIAFLERVHELAARESGDEQAKNRRTTRRSARSARQHYFDKLSKQQWEESDPTSSKIGTLMADSLLVYDETSEVLPS